MRLESALQQLADAGCEVKFRQHPKMGWGFTVEYVEEEPSGFEQVVIAQRHFETQELAIDCMIEMCVNRRLLNENDLQIILEGGACDCEGCHTCQCGE